jgi:hypothetical protein
VADRWSLADWREVDGHLGEPEEILGAFSNFLRECPPDGFQAAVRVARGEAAGAGVWVRLFGVASERPGIADDLLWPVATSPTLLKIPQVARDAVAFLAAVYPSRSALERRAFETAAVAPELIEEPGEKQWWGVILSRFLSSVPVDALETEAVRALRKEFAEAGKLKGNEPFVTFSSGPVSREEGADYFFRSSGVDLTRQPEHEVREAESRLAEALKQSPRELDSVQIAALWHDIQTGLATVQKFASTPPHPQLLHAFWGTVSNVVERIAGSKAFDSGADSKPALRDVLHLLLELAQSPYPEAREKQDDGVMGWGSSDVRVYAASSLIALAPRFGAENPAIIDTIRALLTDPVPAVRLQLSRALNVLWNVARDAMWEMVNFVAEREANPGVLAAFVSGTLRRVVGGDMTRAEETIDVLLRRLPLPGSDDKKRTRSELDDAVAGLMALLWVSGDRRRARTWIDGWIAAIASHERYLSPLVLSLRDALFFLFTPEAEPAEVEMYRRAKILLTSVVTAAADLVMASRTQLMDDSLADTERSEMERRYHVGIRLLDQACKQIYFGSGAFERKAAGDERPGLEGAEAKKLFLKEYMPLLERLAQTGVPSTVHDLLQLYSYVADADPGTVFDRVSAMVQGSAAAQGYQHESMASEAVVKFVRRYLADYRAEFEDKPRRRNLVKVLEVFAQAGSPDAMKLPGP